MKNKTKIGLGAAALSMVMVAAGTFAWFSTTDKVENVFGMDNFDVSITEDFDTPDVPLTPGADITKQVGVTNGGNMDVLVRVKLEEALSLLQQDKGDDNDVDKLKVVYEETKQEGDEQYVPVLISDEMIQAYKGTGSDGDYKVFEASGYDNLSEITVLRKTTKTGDNTVYSYLAYVTATKQVVEVTPEGDNAETPDSFTVKYAYNEKKAANDSDETPYTLEGVHGETDHDTAFNEYYGGDFHTDAVVLNFDENVSVDGTLTESTTWFLADDGYFYYTKPLKGESISDPLLESVSIKEKAGNALKGATYTITPVMEAVQVDYAAAESTWTDMCGDEPAASTSATKSDAKQVVYNIVNYGHANNTTQG